MKRIPILPMLVVALAVATMVALGLWQLLDRHPQKQAYLALLAANPQRSPVAFPAVPDERLLFRRSSGSCLPPVSIGLAGAGKAGFRAIASCGNGMLAQLGTTRDPNARVRWAGGPVEGRIAQAPIARSLIGELFDHSPPRPMLVLATPVAGLGPNPVPTIDAIPNNHLAYAGQWFFFAAVASLIYWLALRRRV